MQHKAKLKTFQNVRFKARSNNRNDNDLPQGFDQKIKNEDNKDDVTKCHSAGNHGPEDSPDEEPNFNLFGSQQGNIMGYKLYSLYYRPYT